ncbi:MAG: S-methyl-5-thioribose-1-phosphate isomerase [Bacteroidales bacterium]|nr:S-methyl-5-thioribose-1-phosphate isomerase [Bacteroidales bacterium]
MKINGKHYHTIWLKEGNDKIVQAIDQSCLPFELKVVELKSCDDVYLAIKNMLLRGAPLIGVAAAYGMYISAIEFYGKNNFEENIKGAAAKLKSSRPTAVNLAFAVDKMLDEILKSKGNEIEVALKKVKEIEEFEIESCKKIGEYGVKLIEEISKNKNGETVNILTHCNAGWLACIDYGTATAPVYAAFDKGIKVHVWVDETRPKNQGARLTAFELEQHGVPYTVISDNTGGHLMQNGMVDMVIVGSDRTAVNGDVANKIGTYLKALAAKDNNIPFYVALPSSSIDFSISDGLKQIPIEERSEDEVKYVEGFLNGNIEKMLLTTDKAKCLNYAFDITPAKYITGLITEKGICKPNKKSILKLFK